MPNPNSLEYSNSAVRVTQFIDILDENGHVISTNQEGGVYPKGLCTFQPIFDGQYRTLNMTVFDRVVFTMSENPDAQWNANNSSYQGNSDLNYAFEDIFTNFYNS